MQSSLQFLAKARALIERGDPDSLRYASLEMRFALEDHVYRVLQSHAARIPQAVLSKWQPPQAMKALIEFEPRAARSKIMRFARDLPDGGTGEWKTLGRYTALPLGRLRSLYNKLGSYLHRPQLGQPESGSGDKSVPAAAELLAIASEIEPALGSTVFGSLAEVIHFDCLVCGHQVIRNKASAVETSRATCLNPACNAEHVLWFDAAGLPVPRLDATDFDCLSCKAKIPVENRLLEIGARFTCPSCKRDQVIEERHWGYRLVENDRGGVA